MMAKARMASDRIYRESVRSKLSSGVGWMSRMKLAAKSMKRRSDYVMFQILVVQVGNTYPLRKMQRSFLLSKWSPKSLWPYSWTDITCTSEFVYLVHHQIGGIKNLHNQPQKEIHLKSRRSDKILPSSLSDPCILHGASKPAYIAIPGLCYTISLDRHFFLT